MDVRSDQKAMIVGISIHLLYVPHCFYYVPVYRTLCSRKLFANKGQNNLSKGLYFEHALYRYSSTVTPTEFSQKYNMLMLSSIPVEKPMLMSAAKASVLKFTEAVSHIEAENFGSNSSFPCIEGCVAYPDSNCESKT